jgi:cytochrome c biogenesis protein CcmG, thiol:disulfide interchange protein DsbE
MTRGRSQTLVPVLVFVASLFLYWLMPSRPKAPAVGLPAPDFELPSIEPGEPAISLRQLRGRVVVLDFWASWCAPCRAQGQALAEAEQQFSREGVSVIGINTADSAERALEFLRRAPARHPTLFDRGDVARAYGASGLPTLVFIDANGTITDWEAGMMSPRELLGAVSRAHKGATPPPQGP